MEEGDPSTLLNTGEATSEVLGPVLGSLVQKRHGYTGTTPVQGNKDDQGTGAPFIGEAESWGC